MTADLSVVIPVYNSSSRLIELGESLVKVLLQLSINFEIVMIDDGSTDDSFEVVKRLHTSYGQICGIRLKNNMGQHIAVSIGLIQTDSRFILTIDDDMKDAVSLISDFWRKILEGFDVVSGARTNRFDDNSLRSSLTKAVNKTLNYKTERKFQDITSPMKLFNRNIVQDIDHTFITNFLLPEYVMLKGQNIYEIPIILDTQSGIHSRYTSQKLINHLWMFIKTCIFIFFSTNIKAFSFGNKMHLMNEIKSQISYTDDFKMIKNNAH